MTEQPYKLALTFSIASWAKTWRMEFNKKWKILHTGRNNPMCSYTMNGIPLTEVDEEKDIGVIIHKSLKPSRHCAEVARKANIVLGQISRSFHYRDRKVFIQLYKQHVRSLLEFSAPSWLPCIAADKAILEKNTEKGGQNGFWLNWSDFNEERLIELNLPTPQMHR